MDIQSTESFTKSFALPFAFKRSLTAKEVLQAGLKGETMNLISQHGASSVEWIGGALATQGQQPLKWYKVGK